MKTINWLFSTWTVMMIGNIFSQEINISTSSIEIKNQKIKNTVESVLALEIHEFKNMSFQEILTLLITVEKKMMTSPAKWENVKLQWSQIKEKALLEMHNQLISFAKLGKVKEVKQGLENLYAYDKNDSFITSNMIQFQYFFNAGTGPIIWKSILSLREQRYYFHALIAIQKELQKDPENLVYLLVNYQFEQDVLNAQKQFPEVTELLKNKRYLDVAYELQKYRNQVCRDSAQIEKLQLENLSESDFKQFLQKAEDLYKQDSFDEACEILHIAEPFIGQKKLNLSDGLRLEYWRFCKNRFEQALKNNYFFSAKEVLSLMAKIIPENKSRDLWQENYLMMAKTFEGQGINVAAFVWYYQANRLLSTAEVRQKLINLEQKIITTQRFSLNLNLNRFFTDEHFRLQYDQEYAQIRQLAGMKKILLVDENPQRQAMLDILIHKFTAQESPILIDEKKYQTYTINATGEGEKSDGSIKGYSLKAQAISSLQLFFNKKLITKEDQQKWAWGKTGWVMDNVNPAMKIGVELPTLPNANGFYQQAVQNFIMNHFQAAYDYLLQYYYEQENQNAQKSEVYETYLQNKGCAYIYLKQIDLDKATIFLNELSLY